MTILRIALFSLAVAAIVPAAVGQPVKAHGALVHAIAVSPDGKLVATAGFDNTVKVWDVGADGSLKEKKVLSGHTGPVYAVAFHPKEAGVLVSASLDKTARVWNLADGKTTLEIKGHTDIVDTVAYSPDGKAVATAGADKSVRLWNAKDGKELKNLGVHTGSVYSVAFSADGKYLASAGGDAANKEHVIKVWDVAAQKELKTLKGHEQPVTSVTFGADSNTLISASMDRTIRIWDVTAGKDTKKLGPTTDDPYSVAWDPKNKVIAVCGYSGQVSTWTPTADKPTFSKAIKSPGYCVVFTADGKALISGHDNGSVVVTPIGK
jgi:WD40 repeat protein